MKKQTSRRRIDVNVEELDRVIDETENGPLNEADRQMRSISCWSGDWTDGAGHLPIWS